jgi:nitroimidazol reductase NimA-like FMN-containing flavoprotein (pyridoxamine 5'-phosphate oxidase superfamily)
MLSTCDDRDMAEGQASWRVADAFDLDAFLERPVTASLATNGQSGPTVRPVWYLWEEGQFWLLTGSWSSLERLLERDPRVALVVDTCDLGSGEILQVMARGRARVLPFDPERARRWGSRYLGPDESQWGRFRSGVFEDRSTRFVAVSPESLVARNLSY